MSSHEQGNSALPRLTDETLVRLLAAERAVLVLTRSGCDACATYEADVTRHRDAGQLPRDVAIGALVLDARDDGVRFKRANAAWLAELDFLPYTLLYVRGRLAEEFATTHAAYLVERLGAARWREAAR